MRLRCTRRSAKGAVVRRVRERWTGKVVAVALLAIVAVASTADVGGAANRGARPLGSHVILLWPETGKPAGTVHSSPSGSSGAWNARRMPKEPCVVWTHLRCTSSASPIPRGGAAKVRKCRVASRASPPRARRSSASQSRPSLSSKPVRVPDPKPPLDSRKACPAPRALCLRAWHPIQRCAGTLWAEWRGERPPPGQIHLPPSRSQAAPQRHSHPAPAAPPDSSSMGHRALRTRCRRSGSAALAAQAPERRNAAEGKPPRHLGDHKPKSHREMITPNTRPAIKGESS